MRNSICCKSAYWVSRKEAILISLFVSVCGRVAHICMLCDKAVGIFPQLSYF